MNGAELDFCTNFKHLGNWLLNKLNDEKNLKREMRA